ncbi:MAG: D-alanyl-D-alanine carboxypeptidase [Oscillospiraceae bacterium]|nr:D-alanyl-D-alanine carboxypeptidase [Oscillospiraceae bacterium]
MKIIRITAIFLLLSLLLSSWAFALPLEQAQEQLPTVPIAPIELNYENDLELEAAAYALVELNSNTIVHSKELDMQRYPASLTKIMTCMLAIQYGNMSDVLTVSSTALEGLSIYGSTAGLVAGEEMSLENMLYCIMLWSANEGCNVVAEYISGSVENFVALMNRTAQALGMNGTHFANTHGLHDETHYTTVRDLITLSTWAWNNETFRKFCTATTYEVPATNKSAARTLHTTNYLTSTDVDSRYYYSNASGIKTGFTTPAGGCLISTATDGDAQYLSIVMGCETNKDGKDMRFVETRRLFRHAFENFAFVQVLTDTGMLSQPQVENASGRGDVVVHSAENASILLPVDYKTEDILIKLRYRGALEAPLSQGEVVGTVVVEYQGRAMTQTDLITLTAVEVANPANNGDPDRNSQEKPSSASANSKEKFSFKSILSTIWRWIRIPLFLICGFVIFAYVVICVYAYIQRKRREKLRRQRRQRRRRYDE